MIPTEKYNKPIIASCNIGNKAVLKHKPNRCNTSEGKILSFLMFSNTGNFGNYFSNFDLRLSNN